MAKGRKTGGRQKGTPNRVTAKREAEIAATGLTPLEFMLGVLRDESAPRAERMDAAKNAAPYCHAKLQAIDMKAEHRVDADVTLIELVAAGPDEAAG